MPRSKILTSLALTSLASLAAACGPDKASISPDDAVPAAPADTNAGSTGAVPVMKIVEVLAGDHRDAKHRARDVHRHPSETLAFFGVTSTSKVVELWPGGSGWYTEILAPLLRDEGKLTVTNHPTDGEPEAYQTRSGLQFAAKLSERPDLYDRVEVITTSDELVLGPDGSVDVVLTFRNTHSFYGNKNIDAVFAASFKVLAPGGVFGVVQHRAAEGADPNETAEGGYLPEATVIDAAKKAGFTLAESSQLNANPKDTKDHPNGVWSLAPSYAAGKDATDAEKTAHQEKMEPIGESDRMTLKFVKPN